MKAQLSPKFMNGRTSPGWASNVLQIFWESAREMKFKSTKNNFPPSCNQQIRLHAPKQSIDEFMPKSVVWPRYLSVVSINLNSLRTYGNWNWLGKHRRNEPGSQLWGMSDRGAILAITNLTKQVLLWALARNYLQKPFAFVYLNGSYNFDSPQNLQFGRLLFHKMIMTHFVKMMKMLKNKLAQQLSIIFFW